MNPKKFRSSVGKPSETAETAAARCSTRHRHWQRVGSRTDADEGNKTGRSGTSSSSLSSYVVGEDHHHMQQGKQRTNIS